MIEVIYSGETRKPKTQAEETLAALKNIRQIGNAGGNTRIYVEDRVMSFLNRQMQKKDPLVAALLGRESVMDDITYLFVDGALLAEGITVKGETLEFAPQAFPKLYEEIETFFPERVLLGWYLPAYGMIGKYAGTLGQNSRLFLLEDPTESEELFYLWQQNHLVKQGGYYVYYQKNEEMKAYMQSCREKLQEEPARKQVRQTDPVMPKSGEKQPKEQREDFIDDYQETDLSMKLFSNPPSRLTVFLYASSTVLAIVVLVIGITLINNYEKMYQMQEAIETIASTIQNKPAQGSGEEKADAGNENGAQDGAQGNAQDGAQDGSVQDSVQDGSVQGSAQDGVQDGGTQDSAQGSVQENSVRREGEAVQNTGQEQQDGSSQNGGASPAQGSLTGQLYTIQQGDTLASISRKLYQTTDKIDAIKQLNQGLDENELIVGEKIILP